jgi:hypothetical protein
MIAGYQLSRSGPKALVDRVLLELRDAVDPSTVLRTRVALLLRDGSVVAADGLAHVSFAVDPGPYHIAVSHRNHLGVMTAVPLALAASITVLDFSSTATPAYGNGARKLVGATRTGVRWAGDVNGDGLLKYTGMDKDRNAVLLRIGGTVPTRVVAGYVVEYVNLSGV